MVEEDKIKSEDSDIEIKSKGDVEIKGEDNIIKIDAGKKDVEISGDDNKIRINTKEEIKKITTKTISFLKQKKVQNALVIIALIAIIVLGTWIRVQNLPNLIDSTTGDYIPLALDPFYFLRVAETFHENGGVLPEVDNFRSPHLGVPWSNEILPQSTLFLHKIISIFSPDSTLRFANVLNPVIFFALGLIIFFFLIWLLTKNKWIAIISSFILTIIPPYLYRTLAGFSDHEAIGMFGFFLALLTFAFGMFYLEKKKIRLLNSGIFGLIAGLMTMFAIASWGGGAKFLFMILPLAFLVNWFVNKKSNSWNSVLFYGLFVFGVLAFAPIFGFPSISILKGFMVASTGILTLFTLGYVLLDLILIKTKLLKKNLSKYRSLFSFGGVIILGAIFYQFFIGDFFNLVQGLISRIINPFGTERVSITVAENKQPYLTELIGQVGKTVFYTFLGGCFIVGGKLAKGIENKKFRYLFTGSFSLFIIGILFSRISASSILNGENFLSHALYTISFFILVISTIYIYRKSDWKINTKWIIIAAWMIPMLLAVRSAIRVFFAIVPFISFMVPLAIFGVAKWRKKNKDDLMRLILIVTVVLISILLISTCLGYYKTVKAQATYQSPSYNSDWQNAMSWVRDNTPKESIFLHWWDYGYWVQTGGQRPTIADGGHSQTGFGDHLIGRYVLTTPYPETAKSFMKTHNVSYLLIDPTDIGKYPAYSSIGDDKETSDRSSFIVTFISNPSEIQETKEGEIRLYRGGIGLDGDFIYEGEEEKILFAKEDSALGGIIIEKKGEGYVQPIGIFIKNNKQYKVPLRYLFIGGELINYNTGIESTAYIYPNLYSSSNGQQIDLEGAVIYLSEKTMNSLVAKLYLMNDPLGEYSELELVHEESVYPFNFYYQGFRGPIRIWKVGEMEDILAREEFTFISGEYGEFDDLIFTK